MGGRKEKNSSVKTFSCVIKAKHARVYISFHCKKVVPRLSFSTLLSNIKLRYKPYLNVIDHTNMN